MKKIVKVIRIITVTVLISLVSTVSVQATSGDSTTNVYVVTNENLTAYFDGVAGGDITYWIDGIEVKGEFESLRDELNKFIDVWNALNELKNYIEETNNTANDAYNYANLTYNCTQNNSKKLEEHNQTLILYHYIINSTINELVAFEKAYLDFKNETHLNFTSVKDTLDDHEQQISILEERVDRLESNVDELESTIGNIGKGLSGIGLIAVSLFLANRYHPLRDVVKRSKGIFGNHNKKQRIKDSVHKSSEVKAKSKSQNRLKQFLSKHINFNGFV